MCDLRLLRMCVKMARVVMSSSTCHKTTTENRRMKNVIYTLYYIIYAGMKLYFLSHFWKYIVLVTPSFLLQGRSSFSDTRTNFWDMGKGTGKKRYI